MLNVPGVGLARGHQNSERAAGSVLVFGGQQGWRNLPPHQLHLVSLYPDLLKLLSVAAKIIKVTQNWILGKRKFNWTFLKKPL